MNKNSNNTTLILIGALIVVVFAFFITNSKNPESQPAPQVAGINSDGQQIIEITAKGGYSPQLIQAKADVNSTLQVKTNGTFDCSAALTIPALKIQKMLPPTGTTEISVPAQPVGTELVGTCSMGMYSFVVKFV